jgi:hypothetical protein
LILSSLIAGSSSIFAALPANAWDYYAVKALGPFNAKGIGLYQVDSANGSATLVGTRCDLDPGINTCLQQVGQNSGVNSVTGEFVLENANGDFISFDPSTNTWTNEGAAWASSYTANFARPTVSGDGTGAVKVEVGGLKIYERKATGEIHIGENSLITKEENGIQKLYAKDADGNAIPINITNGSDFQINGVSVQGQINTNAAGIEENKKYINNLGSGVAGATALTAALSSLPVAADDAPFSCAVGTGGYSSRFAMGLGCAARINDRISFNAGGSHVFGGSTNYGGGTLDTFAARAGFVFKIGTIHKPATGNNDQLQSQLDEVKEENYSIKSRYESMEQRYISIEQQNNELIARLERLEAIALGNQSSTTTVSLK